MSKGTLGRQSHQDMGCPWSVHVLKQPALGFLCCSLLPGVAGSGVSLLWSLAAVQSPAKASHVLLPGLGLPGSLAGVEVRIQLSWLSLGPLQKHPNHVLAHCQLQAKKLSPQLAFFPLVLGDGCSPDMMQNPCRQQMSWKRGT